MELLKTVTDFRSLEKAESLIVVHFLAEWAPQCSQVTDVLKELAKDPICLGVRFVQIEAEELAEISMEYEIEAVPTVIIMYRGKILDRVDGVKIAELTEKVRSNAQLASSGGLLADAKKSKEELNSRLLKLINSSEVMVFIVGTPEQPRCGFTRAILQILNERNVKYDTYNVMADDDVCEGLKVFSNWPTYPQVYIDGKLIGGLDIVKELIENGEFEETFPKADSLEDRLKSLITKSDIMLFMKGDSDTPRCGFSKQAIELLNSKGVKYETFDILSDEDVRQGLKEYSKWPTYPQLYVKGNLVGGIDIMKELESSGELGDALNP